MKHFLLLALGTFSLSALSQSQQLQLASDVWPPFTNVKSEKSVALDLVQTALERINISSQFTIEKFDNVVTRIENHQFDGSAALWKTEDREKTMIFSDAYLQNQLILVGRKGSDVNAETMQDMTGKRIGIVSDYAYNASLLEAKNVELIYGANDQENLEKLLELQIDYMLVDALLIEYLMQYQLNDVQEYLAIGEKPFEVKGLHFALRKDVPHADSIMQLFNTETKAMQTDGTYNQVLEISWLAVDVDNDGQTELVMNGDAAGSQAPERGYELFYNDSSTTISSSYQVNGTLYKTWDDVPETYKENMYDSPNDPAKGNMIIRF